MGKLKGTLGSEECGFADVVRVDLIAPDSDDLSIVNSKSKKLDIVYKTNPVGDLEYKIETVDDNVGKILGSNKFKPGGNGKVFENSASRLLAKTGLKGEITVYIDEQYVLFKLVPTNNENQVEVTNAPPTISSSKKPNSPLFDTDTFSATGRISLLDIDDKAEHYISSESLKDNGILSGGGKVSVVFKGNGVTGNGNRISANVKVNYVIAKNLFKHMISVNFTVGSGVEAGIIVAGVTLNAGISGVLKMEIPSSRVAAAVTQFLSTVAFPAGSSLDSAANFGIKDFIAKQLDPLLNQKKVKFDLMVSLTDGGDNKLTFPTEMDFNSTLATGSEIIKIKMFAQ